MEFEKKGTDTAVVSVNALRGQVMQRLSGLHSKLQKNGISADFRKASDKGCSSGDTGFLGSLIFNSITCGALGAIAGLSAAFTHAVAAGMEGSSFIRDADAHAHRGRKLDDYPEGRRASALRDAHMANKFNLLSAAQTNRFSFDTQADIACMYETLDILDRLEAAGARMMRLDRKQPLHAVLKKVNEEMFGKGGIRSYAAPTLMAL